MPKEYTRSLNIRSLIPSLGDVGLYKNFDQGTDDINVEGSPAAYALVELIPEAAFASKRGAHCKVTRISSGDYVGILLNAPSPPAKRITIEAHINLINLDGIDYAQFVFEIWTGTLELFPGFHYLVGSDIWQYCDANDVYQNISGSDNITPLGRGYWFRARFNLDLKQGEYISLEINDNVFDLEGIAIGGGSSTYYPRIDAYFITFSSGDETNEWYLDEIAIYPYGS